MEHCYQILVRRWCTGGHWMLEKGSHIRPSRVSAPWPANNRRKKNQGMVWNSLCHAMWWQWVTPLRFSFKMADLLPGKIPVAHSAWVYACAWAWCFCVFFFSLCLTKLRSYAYVYTDSSVSLHPNCQTVCLTETHAHVESARRLAVHQTVRSSL